MTPRVLVQHEPFDASAEAAALEGQGVGAVVSFSGRVRDRSALGAVEAIELEHYPGMTERVLTELAGEAGRRWSLLGLTVIHRIGYLPAGSPIVFVGAAAAHRADAFAAAAFLMDLLKTRAPFWKREWVDGTAHWVEAKASDDEAAHRWAGDDARPA